MNCFPFLFRLARMGKLKNDGMVVHPVLFFLLAVFLLSGLRLHAQTVTHILPPNGTTEGGTAVTIVGSGFTGASSVSIGGVAPTEVTIINDSTINCTTGAHAAGKVDVVVGALTGGTVFYCIAFPLDVPCGDQSFLSLMAEPAEPICISTGIV